MKLEVVMNDLETILRDRKNTYSVLEEELKKDRVKKSKYQFCRKHINRCRDAICNKDIQAVRLFLKYGISPRACATTEFNGNHRLIWVAAKVDCLEIIKLLVETDKKIEYKFHSSSLVSEENGSEDALSYAIQNQNVEMVKYLLEKGANANGHFIFNTEHAYKHFLSSAVLLRNQEIFDLLINYGAHVQLAIKDCLQCLQVPEKYLLKYARLNENSQYKNSLQHLKESLQMLLDGAIGVNLRVDWLFYKIKKTGVDGLNFNGIAYMGEPITPKLLMQQGVKNCEGGLFTLGDIENLLDEERRDALLESIEKKFQEEGQVIDSGGVVNMLSLADAAEEGELDIVKVRLEHGVNPNSCTSCYYHHSAIIAAATNGYVDVVKLLADHPQIDKRMVVSAWAAALKQGNKEIIRDLLIKNDISTLDVKGLSRLHHAVIHKDLQLIEQLIEYGADVNQLSKERLSCLDIAVRSIQIDLDVVDLLLQKKANPNRALIKDTPLAYAVINRAPPELIEILLPVTIKRAVVTSSLGYEEIPLDSYLFFLALRPRYNGWLPLITCLVKGGANINQRVYLSGKTLLYELMKGYRSITDENSFNELFSKVEVLLNLGADPNVKNGREQETALNYFIREISSSLKKEHVEKMVQLFKENNFES